MPSDGSFRWMWGAGDWRAKTKPPPLPRFVAGSSRGRLGPRPPPFLHKDSPEAQHARSRRWSKPEVNAVIVSQLKMARKRVRSEVNRRRLAIRRLRQPKDEGASRLPPGGTVFFYPPDSPVRSTHGELLCYPDRHRKFVAIDTSRARKRARLLRYIVVVPIEDVLLV